MAAAGELLRARASSSSLTVALPAPAVQSEIDELNRKQKAKLDTLEEELENESQLKLAAMANDEKMATALRDRASSSRPRAGCLHAYMSSRGEQRLLCQSIKRRSATGGAVQTEL